MKICFKQIACDGSPQPLENFYKHPQMTDGHLNKCIACTKFEVNDRRKKLESTDPEWAEKEAQRQRVKEMRRYYRIKHTPEYKARHARALENYAAKYPEKVRAVYLANNAIRDGRIEAKTACERCSAMGVSLQKHHPDYSKPLEVEWLCVNCHNSETWKKAI